MIIKSVKHGTATQVARIAGDLKIAKGSSIYVSGKVTAPPLAILEEAATSVPESRPVLFSTGAETPAGTIRTSGTTIASGTITVPDKTSSVVVTSDDLTISASDISTTVTAIETLPAEGTVVTTCKKIIIAAPTWAPNDKVYVKIPVCYIYSATQPRSHYDEASGSLNVVYPDSFVTPTAAVLKGVTEYRLITDHTFSLN